MNKDINKEIDEKKNNKRMVYVIVLLLSIVFLTFGATFAFFSYTRTGSNKNTITTPTEEVSFVYSEDKSGVKLENTVPLTPEQGKGLTDSYDFNIISNMPENTVLQYKITIINVTNPTGEKKAIPNSHIRAYLTDTQGNPLLSPNTFPKADSDGTISLGNVITSGNEGIIYAGVIENSKESPNYSAGFKLKAWIDKTVDTTINAGDNGTGVITSGDNYTTDGEKVDSDYTNRIYSFKVKVEANAVAK